MLEHLYTEVALLEPSERAQLALHLLESLDGERSQTAEEVEAAWNEEGTRRLEAFERGEMPTISAEELHSGAPLPPAR
jgi:putative addiction module component (TIGR02574 family)